MVKAILVDDEVASLEMLRSELAFFADEIDVCASCAGIEEATRKIGLYKPEILLLDIELEEGLSFEILEQFPDLPVHIIFITAYDHYALKAIKYHAFDYLVKPVVTEELHAILRKIVKDI